MINTRLQDYYYDISITQLKNEFYLENKMRVPKLEKICINIGTKNITNDLKIINVIYRDIMTMTGQRGFCTRAKKSIAGFKLKKGVYIGCKITLRKILMYEFLDRLINIALPRVRDFKGFRETQFDGCGNFSLGIKEYTIFPEINYIEIEKVKGMNIVIVTSTKQNKEARLLLETLNFPFCH